MISTTLEYIEKVLNIEFTLENTVVKFTKENDKFISNWTDTYYDDEKGEEVVETSKDILEYNSEEDMLIAKKRIGFKYQENKLALYIDHSETGNNFEFLYWIDDQEQ